jgi:hypothetical protein
MYCMKLESMDRPFYAHVGYLSALRAPRERTPYLRRLPNEIGQMFSHCVMQSPGIVEVF